MAIIKDKKFIIFAVLVVLAGVYLLVDNFIWSKTSVVEVTSPVSSTNVIHYVPDPSVLPSNIENGSCFANSVAAPYRDDAWRCSVGNSISDPCFQIPGSQELLCKPSPTNPSAPSTFVLRLTQPLPAANIPKPPYPKNWGWLVELSDGTVCSPFTGTLPFSSGGDVANYSCSSNNPEEGMIFNGLNATTTPWMAEVGSLPTSGTYPPPLQSAAEVPIQTVWQ